MSWAIDSVLSTIYAVQAHYASIEGLVMMHMEHAVAICTGIMHLCLLQRCNPGDQDRCSNDRSQLKCDIDSVLSTVNAVQAHYASIEGLAMMHMEHAVAICTGIMHLCLIQWCNPGGQNR